MEILARLKEARDEAIRLRKAKIVEDFLIARRLLLDTYRSFSADEVPLDLSRVLRDLEIERNGRIDGAVSEMVDMYAMVESLVQQVSRSRSPRVADAGTDAKHLARRYKMSRKLVSQVVEILSRAGSGVCYSDIIQHVGPANAEKVHRLIALLRKDGLVVTSGRGRGTRHSRAHDDISAPLSA